MQEPDPLRKATTLRRIVTIAVAFAPPLGLVAFAIGAFNGTDDATPGLVAHAYPEPPSDGFYVPVP